jgi:hypothetical protein
VAAEQAADLAARRAAHAVAGRLRERRLALARKISKQAGPAVAELTEVLCDLQFLAEPAAAGMA